MTDFEYEPLDVYRAALAWLIIADEIAEHLPAAAPTSSTSFAGLLRQSS